MLPRKNRKTSFLLTVVVVIKACGSGTVNNMETDGGWGVQYETAGTYELEWSDWYVSDEPFRFATKEQAEQYITDMVTKEFNRDMQLHLESVRKAEKAADLLARRKALLEEAGLWDVDGDIMYSPYTVRRRSKPDLEAQRSRWRVVPDGQMNAPVVSPVVDGDVFLVYYRPYQVRSGLGYPCTYDKKAKPVNLDKATKWIIRGGEIM